RFDADVWAPALKKLAGATHLTVSLFDAGGEIACGPNQSNGSLPALCERFLLKSLAGGPTLFRLSLRRRSTVKQLVATSCAVLFVLAGVSAQAPSRASVPTIPFDSSADFLKISPDMNFGELLAVAVNSKGHVVVLNHPGSATSGPLYGNASTQLLEFDQTGKFVREIGKGVYGLGYSHSVRFDKYDNLWVVDK